MDNLALNTKKNKFDKIALSKKFSAINGQISLFKLTSQYFWRSWTGPFFAFIFPIICIAIMGYLMSYAAVLGGAICLGSYVIAIYALPNSIYDFKKSSLLKRIGVTPLNPMWFMFVICLFYFIIMIISIIWCFLFSMMIFSPYWNNGPKADYDKALLGNQGILNVDSATVTFMSLKNVLGNIEWGGYIFSFLLSIAVGTTMGITIVSLSRTAMQLQSMSVLVIIISILVGGQAIPMCIVRSIQPIWYISYFICPFKSTLNMSTESWNGPLAHFINQEGVTTIPAGELWDIKISVLDHQWDAIMYSHMQNINESTIWNVNSKYVVQSTVLLPHVTPSEITILGKTEKILDFIIPFVWIGIFLGITAKKFKWSSR